MTQHNDTGHTPPAAPKSARRGRRWILAGVFAAAAGAIAVAGAGFANAAGALHGHHQHGGKHQAMNPAEMEKHIDQMVEEVVADGTAEQKAQVAAIAKAAFTDLQPAHKQFHDAHARAHDLLMQPTVDRAALEQLRLQQMQQLDTASRRILLAVADAAQVLTVEQRGKFAEHMKNRMH